MANKYRELECICGARELDEGQSRPRKCWDCKKETMGAFPRSQAEGGGMNIGEKADYVRDRLRSDPGGHHCHWTGCDKKVPAAQWGCKKHWYMLPPAIRSRIWRAFRPGQEESKAPSREYVAVAREAQDWIAANHPPERTLL